MATQKATLEDLARSVETNGAPTDVHRLTASKAFNVPYEQVTEHQRRAAKAMTFFQRYR